MSAILFFGMGWCEQRPGLMLAGVVACLCVAGAV